MTEFEKAMLSKFDMLISILQNMALQAVPPQLTHSAYTLFSWLDEWYKTYKAPTVKPRTLAIIEIAIRVHIKSKLPDLPLNLITGLQLQKFFIELTKSRTRKTVYDVLNGAFREAVNLKQILDNPMASVKIPAHKRTQGKALEPKAIKDFLGAIKGHKLENYFQFLLYTGCRRNEALDLEWSQVDFKNRLLHINGSKTETSQRTIPLLENVAEILMGIRLHEHERFFDFKPEYVTKTFKKFCPRHKLHDLRHTFAINCLEAKIPLKVVQKWLGHEEIDTTANIYTHVTAEIHKNEAETLNTFLKQKNLTNP
jgi:integrase